MSSARAASFIDTSVVVRYLTGDPPEMADRAAAVIDSAADLMLSKLVLVETAYVLESFYRVDRDSLTDALSGLVRRRNVELLGLRKDLALEALSLCRDSRRVSYTDAFLWAEARQAGEPSRVYCFDRKFPGRDIELCVGLDEGAAGEAAWTLVRQGLGEWTGGKPRGLAHPPRVPGRRAEEVVIEDRR